MHDTSAFRCKCCGLHQPSAYRNEQSAIHSCVRCREHSDATVEDLAEREADHAAMYHHALIDAQDETLLAQGERDHYRDRMQTAYASREVLIAVLAQLDDQHHVRGKRCSCGRRGCRVATALADPRVARLIRSYDEVQRTLRALRVANPDRWVDQWDYIDVSLVYPGVRRPASKGRHRAAG